MRLPLPQWVATTPPHSTPSRRPCAPRVRPLTHNAACSSFYVGLRSGRRGGVVRSPSLTTVAEGDASSLMTVDDQAAASHGQAVAGDPGGDASMANLVIDPTETAAAGTAKRRRLLEQLAARAASGGERAMVEHARGHRDGPTSGPVVSSDGPPPSALGLGPDPPFAFDDTRGTGRKRLLAALASGTTYLPVPTQPARGPVERGAPPKRRRTSPPPHSPLHRVSIGAGTADTHPVQFIPHVHGELHRVHRSLSLSLSSPPAGVAVDFELLGHSPAAAAAAAVRRGCASVRLSHLGAGSAAGVSAVDSEHLGLSPAASAAAAAAAAPRRDADDLGPPLAVGLVAGGVVAPSCASPSASCTSVASVPGAAGGTSSSASSSGSSSSTASSTAALASPPFRSSARLP